MKTKIYGASDDLIEIDGEISDEIGCYSKSKRIVCSDGTIAKISYNGEWKINVLVTGSKYYQIIPSVGDEKEHEFKDAIGCSSYSDVLILEGGIEWIRIGSKTFKP